MSHGPASLRTCIGCRQKWPVSELVRLHAVRDAVPGSATGQQVDSVLVTGLGGSLVPWQARGGGATDGRAAFNGKGAHMCPTLQCARRAVQILSRRPSGRRAKASGPTSGADKGGDSLAVGLLEQVAAEVARLAAARRQGLERRGADLAQDARLGVWEALQNRLPANRGEA